MPAERRLYAGGIFTSAGGVAANCIAKWDGSELVSARRRSGRSSASVNALTTFDDGRGLALYAGGQFLVSPAGDSYLARWSHSPSCGAPGTSCAAQSSRRDRLPVQQLT